MQAELAAPTRAAAPTKARRQQRAGSVPEKGQGNGGEGVENSADTASPPEGKEQQVDVTMSLPAAMAEAGAAVMATMAAPVVAAIGTAMAATGMATGLNAAGGLLQNLTDNSSNPDPSAASEEEPPVGEPDAAPLPAGSNELA